MNATDDRIRRAVDSWPALTAEQRDRLAVLLRAPSDVVTVAA